MLPSAWIAPEPNAALRLAKAEDATLMPAYLATVPKQLPLECAIPAEATKAKAHATTGSGGGPPERHTSEAKPAAGTPSAKANANTSRS